MITVALAHERSKNMVILKKGERIDWQYGGDYEYITDEDIEALKQGRRGFIDVNAEYTVILKYAKKKKEQDHE